MLNDVQHLEASRVTAQQLLKKHGVNAAAAVEEAFRLATARKPLEKEFVILLKLHAWQLERFRTDVAAAAVLLKNGDSPAPADVDPASLAALTMTVSTVMNHAESVLLR